MNEEQGIISNPVFCSNGSFRKGRYDSCPIFVKKHIVRNTRRSNAAIESNCNEFEDSVNGTGKSLHAYIDNFVSNLTFSKRQTYVS